MIGAVGLGVLAPVSSAQLPPLLPTPPSTPAPAPQPAPAPSPPSSLQVGSSTDQANPQRTNQVDDPALVTPLETRWSRTLPGRASSVIYGDGLVYAAVGTGVMALDHLTGRTVWSAPGAQSSGLSFGDGVVVSSDLDGYIRARTARTGALLWRNRVSEYYGIDEAALVIGGVAYASTNLSAYAYDLQTGRQLWRQDTGGSENALAGDGTRVFGSYACGITIGWNARTGTRQWRSPAPCSGGGGSTAIVHRGRVYGSEGQVFDAANGTRVDTLRQIPVTVSGSTGFSLSDYRVRAFDLASKRERWRTGELSRGTYEIGGDPLGVGNSVYVFGKGNRLLAYAQDSGRREQTIPLRGVSSNNGSSATSLASAPGSLLVPVGRRLTAYQSFYRPAPNGIAADAPVADFEFGGRGSFAGVLGTSLRTGRPPVTAQARYPGEKRYRSLGAVRAGSDGFFEGRLELSRNALVRATTRGVVSPPSRAYVYPRFRSKLRRGGKNPNRISASVRVSGPRNVSFRGRRVVLYLGQPRRKRYVRLGASRLRAAGKGRGRAAVRFNAVRAGRKDFLLFCIPRSSRLGLGRPDVLDRRCGGRRVPLR